MPAQLSESSGSGAHRLVLPTRTDGPLSALAEVERALEAAIAPAPDLASPDASALQGEVTLDAGAWALDARQLLDIEALLGRRGLVLSALTAELPETRVAAAGLDLQARAPITSAFDQGPEHGRDHPSQGLAGAAKTLRLHRGTLRAGDLLEVEGSLLLLGDLNPGATVRASGHVLVWGRLRGTAHAGSSGDPTARIVALQLRPLQLRIAEAVARGPEGVPPEGLAEEAALVDGVIQIRPASPSWPLND